MSVFCKQVQTLLMRCKSNHQFSAIRNYLETGSHFGNEPSINNLIYNIFIAPGQPTIYECRKYCHILPLDNPSNYYPFETLPCIPRGVFRCTDGERLGPGSNKCGCYRNPEYFSFQHNSFYDLHLYMRPYRITSPNPSKKP